MIAREEILEYSDSLDNAYYDFPFEGDFHTAVLRHGQSKKWFGVLLRAPESYFKRYNVKTPEDREVLCLKCPPDLQDFLKIRYEGRVLPAYHMNKTHWISVILDSDIEREDVFKLILTSFEIT